jgi:hypothetical protein
MTNHREYKHKRTKGKIGLVVTFVLLIACITVTAVFFLWGQNSKENKQYEAQLKQETESFTDNLVSKLDTIDTGIKDTTTAAGVGEISATEAPDELITEAEKEVIGEELAKLENERQQRILQTLSVAYSQALNEQKQEAFKMADDLIAQGKADWASLVKKGENTAVNKGKLASEYLAKSKVMEEQMDASFKTLTSKMEDQLTAEGIDPTAIIAQYEAEYKKIKQENKSALMEKAMAAVKN